MRFKNIKNIATAVQRQVSRALGGTDGKPYLTERNGILALHFDTLSVQSEMNLDDPDELVIGYTRAMMSFLLLDPSPARIAMIGLGGGSIAKYCYRHLPQSEITVVEINPDVIELRNEFAIPPDDERFSVLLGDGAQWVKNQEKPTDVLIVDGFDAAGLPMQLCCQTFYDDCYASLADNGILVVNLWGGYPHYHEYLARIRTSFSERVMVVDASDSVNKIVLAVKKMPTRPNIRRNAKLLSLTHPVNFQAKSNRLIKALPADAMN